MKILKIYKTRKEKEPFKIWLTAIKNAVSTAQINNRVRRLALGHYGDSKRVAKDIFELRIHCGPGYRVYFSEQGQEIIVLLLGGNKSSQKRDIKQAISYWKDYKEQYYG